jgi:hypothetical protein
MTDARVRVLAPLLLAAALAGCENKCDELVTVLTECVGSEVGAPAEPDDEDDEIPGGDAECSGNDSSCATCVLESKHNLCTEYRTALAECRAAGECEE